MISRPHTTARSRMLVPLLLFVLSSTIMSTAAQGVANQIVAAFEVKRQTVYCDEVFSLTLVVKASGVRLGKSFDLSGLPDANVLILSPFQELPAQPFGQPLSDCGFAGTMGPIR